MTVETMSQTTSTETKTRNLEAFDADLKKIDAELAEMVIEGHSSPEAASALSELDQQFSAAGLDNGMEALGLNALGVNEVEVAFINDFIKRKAEKLIKELRFLARRYPNCTKAIRALGLAVAAFARRNYPSAIYQSYQAAKHFRSCG